MRELEILKKHLGNVEGKGAFEAREIGIQIADSNDFIAALQMADANLKKVAASLANAANPATQSEAIAQSRALVSNASFLGEGVFGTKFSTSVGAQKLEFEVADPFFALENGGVEGVLAYIEDKRDEISTLFDTLDAALSADSGFAMPTNSSFDYKDLFR